MKKLHHLGYDITSFRMGIMLLANVDCSTLVGA
jgi:hypothetical protein